MHLCPCNPPHMRKPETIGVGCASLLERLPQTCPGLLSDCAACDLLDGGTQEVAKGQYLIVEDAELEAIEIESTRTIEIDSFVPRAQIDRRFFDTPYYVTPSEAVGQEAFAVIREAMRSKRMVALGRL